MRYEAPAIEQRVELEALLLPLPLSPPPADDLP
jgi:hypothetical protein